jgi:hypothetical protein
VQILWNHDPERSNIPMWHHDLDVGFPAFSHLPLPGAPVGLVMQGQLIKMRAVLVDEEKIFS